MGQRFSNHLAPIFRDLQGPDASSMTDALPPPMPEVGPSRGRTMRSFGRFSGGWWRGTTARRAWMLTAALGAMLVLNIGANLAVNRWNRLFFDALEQRDSSTLVLAVGAFAGLVVFVAAVGVGIVVTRETLQVRWREWLVGRLIDMWTARKRFYRLSLARTEPANPEYRIADDSRMATEPVVDFAIGLFHALLTALAFIGILWSVGGSITVPVGGTTITIPAYMTVAALVYGIVASVLTVRVGRPLMPGVVRKNEAEAKLRFELTRLRENAESVALVGGERDERTLLSSTYSVLVGRWLHVVGLHARLTWITNASGAMVPVIPLLLATPKYLSGELSLGAVTQLAAAFAQVQVAIAWLVDNYKAVAQWQASAERVMAVVDAVEDLESDLPEGQNGIELAEHPDGGIVLEGLTVTDRAGRVLIDGADISIPRGEKVLITGESGIGKSTLTRAIAGLWPWGRGRVTLPGAVAFVPQRPYLPLGTLRSALLYPATDLAIPDAAIAAMLEQCGLPQLASRLDAVERWDQILSAGERQRLAFVRLFLQRPGVVIMDEATSALDEVSQARLMLLLRTLLAETTVISIGHRPGLEPFHDRRFGLLRGENGARLTDLGPAQPTRRKTGSKRAGGARALRATS